MFGAILAFSWVIGVIWICCEIKHAPMKNDDEF